MEKSRVITRMHFENWRSLRDVTIDDLTPITVLVGSNSSGKSNIVDALHFLRTSITEKNVFATVLRWGGRDKIQPIGIKGNMSTTLDLSYAFLASARTFTDKISLLFQGNAVFYGRQIIEDATNKVLPDVEADPLAARINPFKQERLQLLRENFFPEFSIKNDPNILQESDFSIIDPFARNVPFMLLSMQYTHSDLYEYLQTDLKDLLDHVNALYVDLTGDEISLSVQEKTHLGEDAPSISAGTARIIAMLTAYYALDMDEHFTPGLVVIEEPDTAIHPLLLQKFVGLLRNYVSREDTPRQFILTTHNPMFLNLFEPEEVRIVERQNGETTVSKVDMELANTWFKQDGAYNLGDLWTTRLLGGVPE
ncbi:MAG TPA: AAA family ATPase [Aggregatilineales bacterium]|nr:AAA family ATPase [Aggregatilineales bacterium]